MFSSGKFTDSVTGSARAGWSEGLPFCVNVCWMFLSLNEEFLIPACTIECISIFSLFTTDTFVILQRWCWWNLVNYHFCLSLVYSQKQHIKSRTDTDLLFLALRDIYLRFLTSVVSSAAVSVIVLGCIDHWIGVGTGKPQVGTVTSSGMAVRVKKRLIKCCSFTARSHLS